MRTADARTIEAEAPLSDFSIAPSGAKIAALLKNGKIQVWSIDGTLRDSWPAGDVPKEGILYAGDSRIVAGTPGGMTVFDAASGARIRSWEAADVQWAAASADGGLVVTACGDGTVRLFGLDGSARSFREKNLTEISRVAVSRGGERIAAGGTDADIRLFDARTGAVEHVLDLAMASFALDFSPDGRTLAAGAADGTVALWDAASGEVTGTLGRYQTPVGAVRFSPDGRLLVGTGLSMNPATVEAEARVCDLATRKETAMPLGVSRWNAIGFSENGRPFIVDVRKQTISIREWRA
jgi:WD40 repeat protein